MIFYRKKPLFFLFTCVKDGRPYIQKLFNSLLNQTRINFVHYIYDDGSKSPLNEMVLEYKEKVAKLPYPYEIIYEKNDVNIGLNMATKHCIDKCYLPYFIWIDCDNWVDKNFFKELELTIRKHHNPSLVRSILIFDRKGELDNQQIAAHIKRHKKQLFERHQQKLFFYNNYYYSFFAVNCAKYRTINPKNYFIDKRTYYNDVQVLMRFMLAKFTSVISTKSIGYFMIRSDSESEQFENKSENFIDMAQDFLTEENRYRFKYLVAIPKLQKLYREMVGYYKKRDFIESKKCYQSIIACSKEYSVPYFMRFEYKSQLFWYIKNYLMPKH